MFEVTGIREVQARIAQIQAEFGMPGGVPGTFQSKLDKEMEKTSPVHKADPSTTATQKAPEVKAAAPIPAEKANSSLPLADTSLAAMVNEAGSKYSVDPKLVSAVAEVESGGNQGAVSGAGAIGVMQLMPDTAKGLGVDPYDEQQNVEGGAKYLKQMLDTFGGDVRKAVAAYNAGPQAVKEYDGVPPYRETQDYVNKVLDLYR